MRRLTSAILIGGLMAAGLLAGCGGGGSGGGNDSNPPTPQGIVLTGTVEKSDATPAVGYTVTLKGNRTGVTDGSGVFRIQLAVGETVKVDVYPSADPITPPPDYTFAVSGPLGEGGQPPLPIYDVQYPKVNGQSYPADAVRGDLQVWWGNTNNFGTLVVSEF